MKRKSLLVTASLLLLSGALLPAQSVSYSLPRTSLCVEVEAIREDFHAGPYAKFSSKYLGVDANVQSSTTYRISGIKITPYMEADQSSRFSVVLPKGRTSEDFLKLTSQGLVAVADTPFGVESSWRFTYEAKDNFASKGLSSNLTSATATLYQNVKKGTSFNKVSVQQNMVVEKSLEEKAKEAAEMIFRLRKVRVQVVTGDTDASYSGEAMASVLKELSDLEEEYMSLFVGYSDYQTQTRRFDIVPDKDNLVFVAFRISDAEGLVSSDNVSGKPVVLQITPEKVDLSSEGGSKAGIRYRVPSICGVKLTDGVKTLVESRIPIYQLGSDFIYPLQ